MSFRKKGLDFSRKPKKKLSSAFFAELFSWIFWPVIAAFFGAVLIFVFGLRTNVIGNSMEPLLYSGQEILIDRLIFSVSSPKRGDVVAFQPNGNENSHYYIKRVVGLPGETLKINDGYLYIDGVRYREDDIFDKMADPGILENEVTLGKEEYFVLGDNRNFSEDSRSGNVGLVKSSYMIGKVWFKLSKDLQNLGFVSGKR